MRYQGGKGRLAEFIAPIVREIAAGRPIVEPFHGGLSMTVALQPARASDLSRPVATLIREIRAGWSPPSTLSEGDYQALARRRDDMDDPLVCFAGQCCTFGGKWFGGYARTHARQRNPIGAARSSLLARIRATSATTFSLADYRDAVVESGDLVYCDPPYQDTSCDWPVAPFDHGAFWQWARDLADCGVDVVVSEFSAPEDAVEIWTRDRPRFTRGAVKADEIERLYLIGPAAASFRPYRRAEQATLI
jgi:DNA adenine methylase